ncbi:TonB-dependent receptor [Sphingobium sp.]|uniref:TonB-dependent receptor n=1 Tax=Sphingobium sp. TaxID=1912891 RepID=UPI0028BF1DEE|nr:TonB-dependent receptor [Sphingobium sp.]
MIGRYEESSALSAPRLRRVLALFLASTGLVAFTAPALAQNAATSTDLNGQKTDNETTSIGDIVVTANRRSQKIQDVPIAISAISGDAAKTQGITGTASLQIAVPSLVITHQADLAQPYLRGLGSSNGAPNAEPSVAIYVDGVYYPSAFGNLFDFNNIERIEVLKGPQGTLFGRNATGGVIQILTKDPGSSPEGNFEIGYANYNTLSAQGYVSAPLTDNIGFNFAALYKNQGDGWGKNIFTGKDTVGEYNLGFRSKLVFNLGTATIKLAGDWTRLKSGAVNGQNPPGTTNVNFPLILATGMGDPYPGKYNTNNDFEQKSGVKTGGASLTVENDFGPLQVKSISAYRETNGYWTLDQDLSPWTGLSAILNQEAKMYSQEVHLLSPSSSKLQWLVGAYYFNYKAGNAPQILFGQLLDPNFPGCAISSTCSSTGGFDLRDHTKSTSFAVFAQGTYPIFDKTNLTVGGRYTWDKVNFAGTTYFGGTNVIVPGIGGPISATLKKDAPTFRVSLDHKFTRDIMAYVSWNRGRKSGGFDLSAISMPLNASNPFQPEKLNAYEVGLKTELADGKVRFNVGGYYYDFKNMQFQKIIAGNGVTFNSPLGAQMYGVEADLLAQVTDNLLINGNIGTIHSKLRDFPGAPNTCLNLATGLNDSGGFFCDPSTGLPTTVPYNAKGNHTPNSPAISGSVGFVYTIPSSVGKFALASNVYYSSKSYFEIDNRTHNNAYALVNASLSWTDQNDKFTIRVWGTNLTNHYYYVQYTGQGGASDIAAPAAPRQFGVTAGFKY